MLHKSHQTFRLLRALSLDLLERYSINPRRAAFAAAAAVGFLQYIRQALSQSE